MFFLKRLEILWSWKDPMLLAVGCNPRNNTWNKFRSWRDRIKNCFYCHIVNIVQRFMPAVYKTALRWFRYWIWFVIWIRSKYFEKRLHWGNDLCMQSGDGFSMISLLMLICDIDSKFETSNSDYKEFDFDIFYKKSPDFL